MKKLIIIFAVLVLSQRAFAWTLSSMGSRASVDYKATTHVFVLGYAGGLGDQFFKSAVARGRRYLEVFPSHQVILIGPDKIDESLERYDSYEEYRATLGRLGLRLHFINEDWLLSDRLFKMLKRFSNIQSLEFFSHSAAHLGVGLEDLPSDHRFKRLERVRIETDGWQEIKKRFEPGAFVVIHGCNSGFIQAPAWARMLEVPVAGSLSSTNTQELFSDQLWYFNDSGRHPPNLGRGTQNRVSYAGGAYSCATGHCHRMRPEPYPYIGGWGRLTAGLDHYKFFCGSVEAGPRCKRAMALFLLGHPGTASRAAYDIEAFRENVKDFLCPDSNRSSARAECFQKLEASLQDPSVTHSGMISGKTVKCNFLKCDVTVSCAGQCQITQVGANPRPQTTQNEFRAYLEGFQLLQP